MTGIFVAPLEISHRITKLHRCVASCEGAPSVVQSLRIQKGHIAGVAGRYRDPPVFVV